MIRLLFDTNVLLDVVLNRHPHAAAATKLWTAVEKKRVHGVVAAHAITTAFYLVERALNTADAHRTVSLILDVFEVAPLDAASLRSALRLPLSDFEDAVCVVAAGAERCDYLVTRDLRGFKGSSIPCFVPEAAAALLTP